MSIIEAVRKWEHLLMRRHFTLITDQRSVAFMFDSRARSKVKHNKIQCWRLESFSYTIRYRPGKEKASCSAITSLMLFINFYTKLDYGKFSLQLKTEIMMSAQFNLMTECFVVVCFI